MEKYPLFIILIFYFNCSSAQDKILLNVSNRTYLSNDTLLPFWFTSNQSGKIVPDGPVLNVFDLEVYKKADDSSQGINFFWGFNVISGISSASYLQLNQGFAGLLWNGWELTAG